VQSKNDSKSYNGKRAQRGVSLIEVLVVLVILVTGILTIIRLFPSGFFSIQSTGNAALANSLGSAAIDLGQQSAQSLPDAILPDDLAMDDLANAVTNSAAYSNYDPDDPNNLENARVVQNETVTVPTAVNGQSVYVVNYGPVVMPADPTQTAAQLPSYFTVNSPYWTAQPGNSAPSTVVSNASAPAVAVPTDIPQDTLVPGREQFLVDLTNKKIAVPYAAYTPTPDGMTFTLANGQVVRNADSYDQKMVMTIRYLDTNTQQYGVATKFLDVPAATQRRSNSPYAPQYVPTTGYPVLTFLPDTASNYHGGWFDPTMQYQDTSSGSAGTNPPTTPGIQWVSVTLYRPYNGIMTGTSFGNDPYQFQLQARNIVTTATTGANPGAISFNPKAATGSGAQARKAQVSYIVYSWGILREDHDVPALTGTGSTAEIRTAVPNLLRAGSANPDNSINPGIAGSNESLIILDLDTGKFVAPVAVSGDPSYDPTNPDNPINDEDTNGTVTNNPAVINISYSLGRLTFGSNSFADNSKPDGSGTAPAHRIRIFYTADLNWAVAVQKAPAYFSEYVTSPSETATGTTLLGASQFAYNSADAFVYFARCNAGKTVEIDGSYMLNGKTQAFSDTVSVDPTLYTLGDSAVRVDLTDAAKFEYPVPGGATVTFSAVRGLSARSIVAWKERNVYKTHSVDALLNRKP
jgi:prepilin-type N-terminal cleavage/methylation domain-containing protein